jgi:hypothetical protein
MLKTITLVVLIMFSFFTAFTAFAGFDRSHKDFDEIVKAYVKNTDNNLFTRVMYGSLVKNKHTLELYLNDLSNVKYSQFSKWNEDDRLAFLINAYNAFTIKLIVDNYGKIDSIKDIGFFFSNPWKIKFISLFGEKISLDHVEHGMIRKLFSEPLIHGALVCAAKGCPPLRREAYRGNILSYQLRDNMQQFLMDRDKNRYNYKKNRVELSPIFNWYKEDFKGSFGRYESLKKFIAVFSEDIADNTELSNKLKKGEFIVKFNNYDWSLNE